MALATDDYDGSALGAQWSWDAGTPGTATYAVADSRLTVTLPSANFDSISSPSGTDNSAGAVASVADSDLDIAIQIGTAINNIPLFGAGFFVASADETGAVRAQLFGNLERANLYIYHRASGSGAGIGPTPLTSLGYDYGNPAWLRLTRTGDDWAVYLSGDGVTWGSPVASFTRAFTVATVKAMVADTTGGGVCHLDRVVNLAADGTTDARAASPARGAASLLSDDFSGSLPAWLADDSANSGSATVAGGVLSLSQLTDSDGSVGRVRYVGTAQPEAGMLAKFQLLTTSAACFLVIGVGYDAASPPLNQYARGPGFVLEIPTSGTGWRVVRVADPGSWTNFETPFTFLSTPTFADHAKNQWEWVRVEAGCGPGSMRRLRARWWLDTDPEPSTWDFDGQDEVIAGADLGLSLSWSHNDGLAVAGSAVCQIDELSFYALEGAGGGVVSARPVTVATGVKHGSAGTVSVVSRAVTLAEPAVLRPVSLLPAGPIQRAVYERLAGDPLLMAGS